MIGVLIGIGLAVFVFASGLWAVYRAVLTSGVVRWINVALVALIVGTMGALTLEAWLASQAFGAGLALISLAAVVAEVGWSRLLPGIAAVFGLIVASGLPFSGG